LELNKYQVGGELIGRIYKVARVGKEGKTDKELRIGR